MDGNDDDILWNDSGDDENVKSIMTVKALTVKIETVTLIGEGRQNPTCFMY